ncbi:hypothetical protein L3073_15725 [Ancylomarina sp. DW003]|nr:hypothetical protein [Ancylomarina sp. DW003]MDE5423668.1 hypothetical protein [Ancylomarina sp. DW003]
MKSQGSGYVSWDTEQKEKILSGLNLKSSKTIEANLTWLLRNGWVSMNSKRECLRVVSYLVLAKKLNFQSATGAVCELQNLKNFRPFIYAAVVTYYLHYKDRIARQSARKKGRTTTNCRYRDLPADYLAKVLKLGKSTIVRYRQKAWDAGFIKMKHRYKPLFLPIEELEFCRIYGDEDAWQLVIHNNQVKIQLSNAISSYICLRTKPSLKKHIQARKKVDPIKEGI